MNSAGRQVRKINLFGYIYGKARKIQEEKKLKRVVISLAGAGCIGKTTFAENFREFVGSSSCQIVSLDGYMLEREKRKKLGNLTGYSPRGFELCKAKRQIGSLVNLGTPFLLYRYNRQTHRRDAPQLIEPKKIIFIEGGLALGKELFSLADFSVFLDSDKITQFQLRLKREQQEWNSTPQQVQERFEKYYSDYLCFIAPAKKKADFILKIDCDYKISF